MDLYVQLGPEQKGAHMSRFSATVEEIIDDISQAEVATLETLAEIRAAFEQYSVLIFPDQGLDDETQIAAERLQAAHRTDCFNDPGEHQPDTFFSLTRSTL